MIFPVEGAVLDGFGDVLRGDQYPPLRASVTKAILISVNQLPENPDL
jgi:hypothetical protein